MGQLENERNLFFGMLALQNNFIDRDALVTAFNAWVADKSRPIERILVERGLLAPDLHPVVAALAEKYLERDQVSPVADLRGQCASPTIDEPLEFGPSQNEEPPETIRDGVGEDTLTFASAEDCSQGRFQILRAHDRGGLGEVFVARDRELNREVALKVIQGKLVNDQSCRDRFLREAEITGRLEHPGIVPVYGLGADSGGRPYYAMRFIRGESLKSAIASFHKADETGRDPGERALAFRGLLDRFLSACDAIAYAHSRGILHRDLKPSNIMLGPFGETLVVDWGLAKPIGRPPDLDGTPEGTLRPSGDGSSETVRGSVQGTPAYMPPEQATGDIDRLGPPSDVYSMGATLYCLLTGRAAFEGNDRAILEKVVKGEFPQPGRVKRGIPPGLEAVCLKAMATRASDRYARILDLAEDLKHWLADEPVAAYPDSGAQRLARWSRRHRAQTRAAAVALIVVTLVSSVAAVTTIRALDTETQSLRQVSLSLEAERNATSAAIENHRIALENLGTARQAIMELLQGLAARDLAILPQVGPLRVRVIQSAAVFIDRLLVTNPKDPAVQRSAASIYREKANIARGRRAFDEADQSYTRALSLLEGLIGESGRDDDRAAFATTLNDAGESKRIANQLPQAAAYLLRSVDLLDSMRVSNPNDRGLIRREAAARVDLGDLLLDTGRADHADEQYRKAITVLTPLCNAQKPEFNDFLVVSLAWRGLGSALHETRRLDDSLNAFEEVVKRLMGRNDNNSRFLVASTRNRQGRLLAEQADRHTEAERIYREAVDLTGPLARDFPLQAAYHLERAASLNGLGGVRLSSGQEGSEVDCRQALKILEDVAGKFVNDAEYYSQLGLTLDNLALAARKRKQEAEVIALFRRGEEAHRKSYDLNGLNPVYRRRLDEHHRNSTR
jgi:eukaryotic-like serine/threonine-protein kinase